LIHICKLIGWQEVFPFQILKILFFNRKKAVKQIRSLQSATNKNINNYQLDLSLVGLAFNFEE
jgi:uncharacterized membrane protein (UPF0127 family)